MIRARSFCCWSSQRLSALKLLRPAVRFVLDEDNAWYDKACRRGKRWKLRGARWCADSKFLWNRPTHHRRLSAVKKTTYRSRCHRCRSTTRGRSGSCRQLILWSDLERRLPKVCNHISTVNNLEFWAIQAVVLVAIKQRSLCTTLDVVATPGSFVMPVIVAAFTI